MRPRLARPIGLAQAVIVWVLMLAQAAPAAAASDTQCRPQLLAALPVVLLHNIPLVTVTIDGHAASFILDTGAEQTILATAAAKHLGLGLHYEYPHTARGLTGSVSNGQAEMRSMSFGGIPLHPYPLRVGGIALPNLVGGPPDGLLGADILSDFDLDLDIPHRRLTLYRRQSCPDAKPAWDPPYALLSANRSINDHLFFYARLDGRRVAAFFDTGAQASVLDSAFAARLGVGPGALAHDPAMPSRGVTGQVVEAHRHRFERLEVAGVAVRDPVFAVTPLNLFDADLIIGMDWLRAHRLWLSYGAPAIFIAAAP
jgi:predicted aspartyl protease